jgi:hypothetical protein
MYIIIQKGNLKQQQKQFFYGENAGFLKITYKLKNYNMKHDTFDFKQHYV